MTGEPEFNPTRDYDVTGQVLFPPIGSIFYKLTRTRSRRFVAKIVKELPCSESSNDWTAPTNRR